MLLAIGVDSYDTPFAGCTTHFSSLLLDALVSRGYRPLDYPWLVRLNPAAPWKTRGNGAVALYLEPPGGVDSAREAELLLRRLADLYSPGSRKAGYALALLRHESIREYLRERPRCLVELYERAVHGIVPLSEAESCAFKLKRNALYFSSTMGRRGLVGALAALGMKLDDYTFELTAYRRPENWAKPRRLDAWSVALFDAETRPRTFLNMDYEEGKPLIAPHGYDPVLYAVRGDDPEPLLRALEVVDAGEPVAHWVIHRSNQATDAHLRRKKAAEARPYENVIVEGTLSGVHSVPGGHVLARLCDETGCIDVAFYRETGRLRLYAQLLEGHLVEVAGQYKPHRGGFTLNAELLAIRGCGSRCIGSAPLLLRPPRRSFHHLMRPPERLGRTACPPGAPCTPIHAPQGFTKM